MRKIIIILIILFISEAKAQQLFADTLLNYEKNIFYCGNAIKKNELLLNKLNFLLSHTVYNEQSHSEIFRINADLLTDTIVKKKFLWNASLLCFLNNNSNSANIYLAAVEKLEGKTEESLLLGILINKNYDTSKVSENLKCLQNYDSIYSCLTCLNELTLYTKKNKLFYSISSAIIPGSGSVMLGFVAKGLISTSLVASSALGLYTLFRYKLYINSFVWGTGLGLKFYTGNIKLTEKLFDKKEANTKTKMANKCKQKLNKILNLKPIDFKLATL